MLRFRTTVGSSLLRRQACATSVIRWHSKTTELTGKDEQQTAAPAASSGEHTGAVDEAATAAQKLNARGPLVKNFYVGIVDKELLGYPEVINREDMTQLQNNILPLKNFFEAQANSTSFEATYTIPTSVLDNVKALGLYGLNVPQDYEGGKGYDWSSSLMATEPETQCPSIASALVSHRIVVDFLREHGSPAQQQRYFPPFASGELVGTEAIYEYNAPEEDFFNTKATYSSESNRWVLNGEKAFVVTGPLPMDARQIFLVIAQTDQGNSNNKNGRGTTVFLVDELAEGVQIGEKHLNFGLRGTQMQRVHFDQVQLTEDCIVGLPHDGNKYAEALIRAGRLRNSLIGMNMAKQALNEMTAYSVEAKHCGMQLKEMEMVRVHLSKAFCATYAMESMIYLTAGLLDEFSGQDVTLEAAITKYYTLKQLYELTSQNLNIIGSKALHAGQPTELALRNAAQMCTQGESMDTLAMFIALTGLQHASTFMSDVVRKSRNPLFHPGHIFGKFLESSSIDNPRTKMGLGDNVHPTLEPAAQCIEHSVARLQMSVELCFTRHGDAVVEKHNEMQRLADISAAIYAMFASTARASRSYCIGLPLADHEMLTATAVCMHGRDQVKLLCTELFNGHFVNNDNNLLRLSTQIAKSKGYFAVHPLTYNF